MDNENLFTLHSPKHSKKSLCPNVESYHWEENLKTYFLILRIMGLWPHGDRSYTPGMYMLYCSVIVILLSCHVFFLTINIYFVRHDIEAVASMYILLATILAKSKLVLILLNIVVVKDRLRDLKNFSLFQPKTRYQKKLIEDNFKSLRRMVIALVLSCIGCNLFWLIPLLYVQSNKVLPFLGWYPYDTHISPFYELTYLYQMFSTSYFTMVDLTVDPLVASFNVIIACQFELLSDNLKRFVSTKSTVENEARENFLRCIAHHQQILSFIKGCNQFYKWIVFWQLIISGLSIGIAMFQLSLMVPFSIGFYSLVSYGAAITLEIAMFCYFGDTVKVKSDLVSYAVFESDWTHLSTNMKKEIIIFTSNVQRSTQITAFNLFILSVETLLKILKTAWSYFALLSNLRA